MESPENVSLLNVFVNAILFLKSPIEGTNGQQSK